MNEMDLFGEIPVSLREVELWLYRVPRLAHNRRWRRTYPQEYSVVDKVRTAKREGRLDEVFGDEDCEFCGQRLAVDLLLPASLPAMDDELRRLRRRVAVLELLLAVPAEAINRRRALSAAAR